jgi:hypothetical protein
MKVCYLVTTTTDVVEGNCTVDISTVPLDENEIMPKDKAKINGTEVTFYNYFPTLSGARIFIMMNN